MKLITINDISPEAREIFRLFKTKGGSEHIANLVALEALLRMVKRNRPRRVLDIGAGIGTLSYLVLRYTDAELVAVEDNEFCLREMARNLAECRSYKVCGYDDFVPEAYDLILIEGGSGLSHDGGKKNFAEYAVSGGAKVVFVEGKRFDQRMEARKAISKYCLYQTVKYEGSEGKGAYEIDALRRGSTVSRPMWHLYYEHVDFQIYRILRRLKKVRST